MGQLRRRKCRIKNNMNLEEGAMKRMNHKQLKNNNNWKLFQ